MQAVILIGVSPPIYSTDFYDQCVIERQSSEDVPKRVKSSKLYLIN